MQTMAAGRRFTQEKRGANSNKLGRVLQPIYRSGEYFVKSVSVPCFALLITKFSIVYTQTYTQVVGAGLQPKMSV